MTDHPSIIALIDGARPVAAPHAPLSFPAPLGAGETRAEGGEAPVAVAQPEVTVPPAAEPQAWGYDVAAMNARYALVLVGSKAVVMEENPVAPIEERHALRTLDAFKAWHQNTLTQVPASDGKVRTLTHADRWLRDPKRRQFAGMCFHPAPTEAEPAPAGYFNLWRGFSVEPVQKKGGYSIFLDHVRTNICGGDAALTRWVMGWMAHLIQRPRERLGTALVFRGKMGTGKTLVGETLGRLIQAHYFLVDDPRYVVGNFNAHMASCLLLQAEEAVWAGDKVAEGRLKGLITSKFQMIENKGVDPIRLDNYVRLIMTSNEGWVVPAGKDERRYAVFDVSDRCKENHAYFGEMVQQLEAGGYAALLYDLMRFDIASVNLRDIPKTEALLEQKTRSLGHVESWWLGRLHDGRTRRKATGWETRVICDELVSDYLEESDRVGIKRRADETVFGLELRKLGAIEKRRGRWGEGGALVNAYLIPPLHEARAAWEALVGQPVEWARDDETVIEGEGFDANPVF